MSPESAAGHRRLRLAAVLIACGLIVEMLTLRWAHPASFITFILAGGTLVAVGSLTYVYSLLSR